jgi:phosphate transport system permease protein
MAMSVEREVTYDDLRRRPWRHAGERVIELLLLACAVVSLATTVAIVFVLFDETSAFFREVSFQQFFLETKWQPLFKPVTYGIWELVAGTVNVVLWSLLIALPLGLAAAIYLSEYAAPRTRRLLKPLLEALAGVPTIVYAYFALTVVTQDILLQLPYIGDRISFFNALGASIMMAVMILPTIASIS